MFTKIKENVLWLGGLLVAALLFFLRKRNKELEGEVRNSEHDKKDVVLESQHNELQGKIEEEKKKLEEAKAPRTVEQDLEILKKL